MSEDLAPPEVAEAPAENHETQGPSGEAQADNAQATKDAAAPAPPTKHKLKIRGREVEWPLERILAEAQKQYAAEEVFGEAHRVRQEAESKLSRLKSDPWSVLKELGLDPRKLSETHLAEQLQEEALDPGERKALAYKRELDALKAERENETKKTQEQEIARQEQKYVAEFDKSITEAVEKSGLPKTPHTFRRMATLAAKNLEMEIDLPFEALADLVREEYLQEHKELLSGFADGESLLKFLDTGVADKIRKADLARLKGTVSGSTARAAPPPPKDRPASSNGASNKMLSRNEWLRQLEENARRE